MMNRFVLFLSEECKLCGYLWLLVLDCCGAGVGFRLRSDHISNSSLAPGPVAEPEPGTIIDGN